MKTDKFPIHVYNSMETHIQHLRVSMKDYTLNELIEVRQIWSRSSVPEAYRELVNQELAYRDSAIKVDKI